MDAYGALFKIMRGLAFAPCYGRIGRHALPDHKGLDVGTAGRRVPLFSPVDGTLQRGGPSETAGYWVTVSSSDPRVPFAFLMFHTTGEAPAGAADGAKVTKGQHIGWVSNTGRTIPQAGPDNPDVAIHLHLDITHLDGKNHVLNRERFPITDEVIEQLFAPASVPGGLVAFVTSEEAEQPAFSEMLDKLVAAYPRPSSSVGGSGRGQSTGETGQGGGSGAGQSGGSSSQKPSGSDPAPAQTPKKFWARDDASLNFLLTYANATEDAWSNGTSWFTAGEREWAEKYAGAARALESSLVASVLAGRLTARSPDDDTNVRLYNDEVTAAVKTFAERNDELLIGEASVASQTQRATALATRIEKLKFQQRSEV